MDAHLNLISIYTQLGSFDLALRHYRAGLAINPDHPGLHGRLGVLLIRQHRYDEAAAEFRQALATDPVNAQAHRELGGLAELLHRPEAAMEEYQAALRIEPVDPLSCFRIGRLLLAKGHAGDAGIYFTQALQQESRQPVEMARAIAGEFQKLPSREWAEFLRVAAVQFKGAGRLDLLASLKSALLVRPAPGGPS